MSTPTKPGTSASLALRVLQPLRVAPTVGATVNTISFDLIAVACVQLPDILFEFDSSFPQPGIAAMLNDIAPLREQHKNAGGLLPPLSIFGHADPVGDDDYNKQLSGRRAMAVYAVLTRDQGLWDQLFDHAFGGDDWKARKVAATMSAATGLDAKTARPELTQAYMALLCEQTFAKADFLGQGADAKGKADFQGCSEFNPLRLLSTSETATLPKDERNSLNASNRRVIVFMFRPGLKVNPARWPCPSALAGPADCRKRFFGPPKTGELRRKPGPARREFADAADTFACRFYDRVARLSPCELPIPLPAAEIEFVLDPRDTHAADAASPVATFVRMGLWDHAFACGNPTTLRDEVAEARNFIGADSRRFYIRVRDEATSTRIDVDWRTLKADSSTRDAPASQTITLLESPVGSGVFTSRALMLVNDRDDQRQAANSGLPATLPDAGSRAFDQSNHRIRRADLDGFIEAEYTPGGRAKVSVKLPVFDRNPDARRRMSLQIMVLRVAAGGAGVVPTAAGSDIWDVELRQIREIYGRIGIAVDTVIAAATPAADVVANGADSLALIDAPAGINPLNVSFQPLAGANDERRLGTAFPAAAGVIRLFYAGGLASGNRGEAWPLGDFGALPQAGACFSNLVAATYNMTHEMGHILTDKRNAGHGGHFSAPAGAAGARLCERQNLMVNGTSVVEGVMESKRLYDEADRDANVQVASILASGFLRAF